MSWVCLILAVHLPSFPPSLVRPSLDQCYGSVVVWTFSQVWEAVSILSTEERGPGPGSDSVGRDVKGYWGPPWGIFSKWMALVSSSASQHRGHLWLLHLWRGAAGLEWVASRDAAKCLQCTRQPPVTRNLKIQSANSVADEKPWFKNQECSPRWPGYSASGQLWAEAGNGPQFFPSLS